jgi:hypothetical protein
MLCHQILAKVCANPLFTSAVKASLDHLAGALHPNIKKNTALIAKKTSEGQGGSMEVERLYDHVRNILSRTLACVCVSSHQLHRKLLFACPTPHIKVRSCVRAFLAMDSIAASDDAAALTQFKALKDLVWGDSTLRGMAEAAHAEA